MTRNGPVLVIEAGRTERHYWRDLWGYRELFFFLAWRDILVRYKQAVIGVAWSVIRPLLTMAIFTFVFGKLAKLPADGVPYPILVFAALLPWQFMSTAVGEGSNSLIQNANIISKVYFPRVIVPMSAVMVSLVDFLISLVLLSGLVVWYRWWPDWSILALPLILLLAMAVSVGFILWLAALNVRYRDFRYVVPFMIQVGLFISPVGFSSAIVPEEWRLLYSLNPVVGVIDGFRWALLGGAGDIYWPSVVLSALISAVILVSGLRYFRHTERTFADVI
ncbi:MAG: ABC transporter permease [Burkholderiales bacterium]|nr:ABC transporter permease [Burkholderiales bacterium]